MKRLLTDALVRSISPPASGRLELADIRCPGLALRITPAGVRSWCFRFRDSRTAKTTRSTIGKYPDVKLAEARERAESLGREVAQGINPVDAKRQARQQIAVTTFAHLAERYLSEHARRVKRSASADERNLRLHVLPSWGNRPFAQIERRDVIALVEQLIGEGKPTLANRVQALISSIFTFAIDADLVPANPCARLRRRGVESRRERTLSDEEIRTFWMGIVRPPVSRLLGLALRLQLLTGVRPGEISGMRRDELENFTDPDRAGWLIPPHRMKAKRAHYVPLSPLARATVTEALNLVPQDQPFVFASQKADGAIRANALPIAMQRFAASLIDNDDGGRTWKENPPTPHDLRRTVATRLAGLGVPGEDVSTILAHAIAGVTKMHYDRYDRAREKRRALERWERMLSEIVGDESLKSCVVRAYPRKLGF
jgi:integrase